MEKTIEVKLTGNEAAQIEAVIDKCHERLVRIFKQMKKDQTEIEKLGARTRARLARMKGA